MNPPSTHLQLADRVVDLARLVVHHPDGTTRSLTTREAQLLQYLADRPEEDISRDELLEHIWEYKAHYATRAVDVAMRRLRAKIEPDPSSPVHLISIHGVGYRFVPALAPVQLPVADARPVDPPDRSTNLTPDHTTFVGREADLATIASLFRSARLITVLGPGGIGKTRLAQHFGLQVFERAAPPGGVWVCNLSETTGLSGIIGTVAAALDVPLTSGDSGDKLQEQLGNALAGRGRTLLILDNFEQIADHAAATVGRWLASAPDLRILVASRERLRIPGEATYELPPLREDDALSLFRDRARAAGAQLDDASSAAIREIIQRLDGLPLAIELAAPRARVLSPEQILERLDQRFELLRGGRSGQARQATLRSAIDWSWDLLTHWEQDALAQCAVFAGGFTLDAVEQVVDLDHHTTAPWPLDIIEALRDKSLLRVYEPPDLPGELRFGMFESIRAYAQEKLDATDLRAGAERRHARFYVEMGDRLSERIDGPGGIHCFRQLAVELDNVLAVHRRMSGTDPETAVRAVLLLEPIFQTRGPYDTHAALVDAAVALSRDEVPALYARALAIRGTVYGIRGLMDPARADLEIALGRVQGQGGHDEVRVLSSMALLHADQSRVPDAIALCEEAVAIARRDGLRRREGVVTGMLGALHMMAEDLDTAEAFLRRSLQIHEREGNARFKALDESNLGIILLDQGRVDEAEEHMRRSLVIHREMRNRRRVATSLLNLASVRAEQWRLDEAERFAREALSLYRAVGYPRFAAVAQMSLGSILLARDQPVDAASHLRSAVADATDVGDVITTGLAGAFLAAALAEQGALAPAAAELTRACTALDRVSYMHGIAICRLAKGFLALAEARGASRAGDSLGFARHMEEAHQLQETELLEKPVSGYRLFAAVLARALERSVDLPPPGPW